MIKLLVTCPLSRTELSPPAPTHPTRSHHCGQASQNSYHSSYKFPLKISCLDCFPSFGGGYRGRGCHRNFAYPSLSTLHLQSFISLQRLHLCSLQSGVHESCASTCFLGTALTWATVGPQIQKRSSEATRTMNINLASGSNTGHSYQYGFGRYHIPQYQHGFKIQHRPWTWSSGEHGHPPGPQPKQDHIPRHSPGKQNESGLCCVFR